MAETLTSADVVLLAAFFDRNGYTRLQDTRRKRREGYRAYKKGDEVRLVAGSQRELALIRRLLRRAGFRLGRPFRKGRQYRQPVYGREAVARFLALIEEAGRASRETSPKPGKKKSIL